MGAFREAPRQLACPRCGEDLDGLGSGVEVCGRCEGVWLPKQTVERAMGTRIWPSGPSAWWRRELECPACAVENRGSIMTPINASGVVVDRCPDHGEWLDAGELGRLLEAPRAIELEAFYERLKPDGELPARLVEFRKQRQEVRERRAAELEAYRAKLEAEQARLRAAEEKERVEKRQREIEAAEAERISVLKAQRAGFQHEYDNVEQDAKKLETEVRALRDKLAERDGALGGMRARLVELERKLGEIEAQLQ